MKRLTFAICLLLPLSLQAQTTQPADDTANDRGFLEGLLEDNLSGAGRDVQIEGFVGALSSTATIRKLTIADETGVWLTLTDVTLNWNRSALLSGRLEVTELSAKELLMPRKPVPVAALPSAEATPLTIPDLPVSVQIGTLSIPKATFGETVLGQAAVLSMTGSAQMADGSASVGLNISRSSPRSGQIDLQASYAKDTENLSLRLAVVEPKDGLISGMIGIPGSPPIDLEINGQGALSNFIADIALRSNEQERLSGRVTLSETPDDPQVIRFGGDLGGDFAPMLPPDYRGFFGSSPALTFSGSRSDDGRITLDRFTLDTEALKISGATQLAANGWPQKLALNATLQSAPPAPVLLPLNGPRTYVKSGQVALEYDRSKGDGWALTADLFQVTRPDLSLDKARISGKGRLVPNELITGRIAADLNGFASGDADMNAALGTDLQTRLNLDWSNGSPLRLSNIDLSGAHFGARGEIKIARIEGAADLDLSVDLLTDLRDISRFSGLAKRDLSGAGKIGLTGTLNPVSGALDLTLKGQTTDIRLGEARLDPFLTGAGQIDLHVIRDQTGITAPQISARTDHLDLTGKVTLGSQTGLADLRISVKDLARGLPDLQGPADAAGTITRDGNDWRLRGDLSAPGNATVRIEAQAVGASLGAARYQGQLRATAPALQTYAALLDQPIAGAVDLTASGDYDATNQALAAQADINGTDLATGIAQLDPLLRGKSSANASISRDSSGLYSLDSAQITTDSVLVKAATTGKNRLSFDGRLSDLSLLVPELGGAVAGTGTAELKGRDWHLSIEGTGPGGTTTEIHGRIAGDGSDADMAFTGTAPLDLANSFMRSQNISGLASYDLRLQGKPSLTALSGRISTRDARFSMPDQRLAFEDITADVTLRAEQAQVSFSTRAATGGTITAKGSIGLSSPFPADLTAQMTDVILTDPSLYQTSVAGPLSINGGLSGGARIAGNLQLGPTELRIPNPSGASVQDLPGLRHINVSSEVQRTRQYAGMIQSTGQSKSGGGNYTLDLGIVAPDRIFVRGRGLDAELGGALMLKGDTSNVLPQGRFDLIRGRLDILGKRLTLTEGLVQLQGAFDPFIRFSADTEAGDTTASITIEGQASAPTLTFSSSPSLPQDEVLALILFGKEISSISAFQALRLAAAIRTLSGKGGEGFSSKIRRGLQLDDLDVTTSDTGATEARAGKYLSENIYSEVTADTEGNSQINLNLNINRTITARGRLTSDGETGIGVFIEKDY